jgi:hypothetical protein
MPYTLTWIPDSPYSRFTKWILLSQGVSHTDHVITWESLDNDPDIVQWNPKRQVPILMDGQSVTFDSFVILSKFLDINALLKGTSGVWLRTADVDLDKVILFLFSAFAAKERFKTDGEDVFVWFEKAAKDLFISSLQALEKSYLECKNVRNEVEPHEVAVLSMLLSIVTFAPEYLELVESFKLANRLKEVEQDSHYRDFMMHVSRYGATVPLFLWEH